jgi:ubiquinone/menaquinone biosynthesis C-methylase UbiE
MTPQTFTALEHAGWLARAAAYDGSFALVTNQAIAPILDSFGALKGKRLLDVACGTGHLAAAAAQRGAVAEGLDFAGTMVAEATRHYPQVTFTEGDAQNLPYNDGLFDYVACAFGLLHMERPERAIAEAYRVLQDGGRYTFTVWSAPAQGGDLLGLILGAVQTHGTLDVPLPPAPPFFRFADADECRRVLTAAHFITPAVSTVPVTWYGKTPQDLLDLIYKSTVRTPMLLEAQTPEARNRIHEAILAGAAKYRVSDRIAIAIPAVMATATKA